MNTEISQIYNHCLSQDECSRWLQGHVAALLGVPAAQVSTTDDLVDQGLDSVRLMTLVERLRAEGADVDFVDLAEHFTLEGWVGVLSARPRVSGS